MWVRAVPKRRAAALGMLSVVIALVGAPGCAPAARRPNVVLVVLDTVRAESCSLYGAPRETTPLLDAFAAHALVYDHAYAVAPWTVPSHASLFTGLYPASHGATQESEYLGDEAVTLAELLRADGYETAGFVNNAAIPLQRGFDQGFDVFVELWRPAIRRAALGTSRPPAGDAGAFVTGLAVERWLEGRRDPERPFLLFVNYVEAHMPYTPPVSTAPSWAAAATPHPPRVIGYDYTAFLAGAYAMTDDDSAAARALYEAEVHYLDAQLGALLDGLYRAGALEGALVVITSDHGEEFGEHGLVGHQFGLYDSVLRIPLVIRYPDDARTGRTTRPASLVDVFATVLDVAGVDAPASDLPRGESLLRPSRREATYAEYYRPLRKLREFASRFPAFEAQRYDRRIKSIRSGDHKLIWSSDGRHELYDIANDPHERRDLAAALPERTHELARALLRWHDASRVGPEPPAREPAPVEEPELARQLRSLGYLEAEASAANADTR